ncbi:MAG: hypothetical protein ACI9UJ_002430, partial [bacterium]
GAAIGEVVLSKKIGNKGAIIGGFENSDFFFASRCVEGNR